jgi:hypothetical protein
MIIEEVAAMIAPKRPFGLADPAPHGGIAVEMKTAFMRQPCIGQQRDVGEADAVADQKSARGKLLFHPRQRGVATLDLVGIEVRGRLAEIAHLVAADRDIGLVAVLFPEQPFIHLRRRKGVRRDQVAATGQVPDDGVGFRQYPSVVEFDGRNLTCVIELEELRAAGLALERIDRDPRVGQREPVAHPFHLQAIARNGIAINFHRLRGLPDRSGIGPAALLPVKRLAPLANQNL